MRIKKYVARSMREALLQIKEELGEDAIILKSRKLPRKVFSLGAQDEVEVTAAVDESSRPESFKPLQMNNTGVYSRPRTSNIIDLDQPGAPEVKPWRPQGMRVSSVPLRETQVIPAVSDDKEQINEIKENINELRTLIKGVLEKNAVSEKKDNGYSGGLAVLHKRLIDAEVKPEIADKLINRLKGIEISHSDVLLESRFTNLITECFPVAGPLKLKRSGPVVVAFVGPTGSGKTTTLAKLAAHCCINKGKRVSIITADTYRIAAIEQIRTFADIVKVGLQVVFSSEEIPAALRECAGDDLVFVDTAGRSQRNTEHMEELKSLIDTLHPDEVHLVLSATTKDSDLLDIVKRYKSININRLLFTKLDETVKVGSIFNLVSEVKIPVSYFTFGQSVPDDIELARPAGFVARLWEDNNK